MSTAFYPTNMRQQPSSGYNSKSTLQNMAYRSWKGTGIFSNPVGVTSTHIRPLTNSDPGNIFPTGFGLPRPIKHYRKGTIIPINFTVLSVDPSNPESIVETKLIEYNINRAVKSSMGSSLGGGNGGTGLISQLIDTPGSFIVKDNKPEFNNLNNDGLNIDKACNTCNGIGIVSSWYPINYLTDKPELNVTNPILCCNQQRKAIQRVLPTSTIIKKNYYQNAYMYLYNRCQTFQQRQFNFISGVIDPKILEIIKTYPFVSAKIIEYIKPGDPLSYNNLYVAQCNPNSTIELGVQLEFINSLSETLLSLQYITQLNYQIIIGNPMLTITEFINNLKIMLSKDAFELVIGYLYKISANPWSPTLLSGPSNPKGCSQVYYKPNNPQFAKQGGVSSSARMLKLTVDTISTAAAKARKLKGSNAAASLANGQMPNTPFIYKDKTNIGCQSQTLNGNPYFFQGQHQNHKLCSKDKNVYNKVSQYQQFGGIHKHAAGNYIGCIN
jgi:hypothetical protein